MINSWKALSRSEIKEIRSLYARGISKEELSERYNCTLRLLEWLLSDES